MSSPTLPFQSCHCSPLIPNLPISICHPQPHHLYPTNCSSLILILFISIVSFPTPLYHSYPAMHYSALNPILPSQSCNPNPTIPTLSYFYSPLISQSRNLNAVVPTPLPFLSCHALQSSHPSPAISFFPRVVTQIGMKDPVTLYLFLFLSGQAATEMGIKGLTINMSGNMRWFCLYTFIFYSTRPTRLGLQTRPILDCKSPER